MSDEVKLLPCDHCGRPEAQHTEFVGMGLVCHIQGNTFSNSKSARIKALEAELATRAIEATRPTDEVVERVAAIIKRFGYPSLPAKALREIAALARPTIEGASRGLARSGRTAVHRSADCRADCERVSVASQDGRRREFAVQDNRRNEGRSQ